MPTVRRGAAIVRRRPTQARARRRARSASRARSMMLEELEDPHLFGALAARNAHLADAASLGPPDLCCLQKVFEPRRNTIGGLLGTAESGAPAAEPQAQGFYHHVIGLDVSSPAPVATTTRATFSEITARCGDRPL